MQLQSFHEVRPDLTYNTCCRCYDVAGKFRGKEAFNKVLVITSGPGEPRNMDPYLGRSAMKIHEMGPEGNYEPFAQ